jgi:hypothetical protein
VLDKPVPSYVFSLAGFFGLDSFGNFLLLGLFFNRFLLESLILAQDERWRRA